MFPIFKRHALKGAPLMFASGVSNGEAIGTSQGEPLYHASLDHEEYEQLLTNNGFQVIKTTVEDPDCEGRTVWLAKYKLA